MIVWEGDSTCKDYSLRFQVDGRAPDCSCCGRWLVFLWLVKALRPSGTAVIWNHSNGSLACLLW
jgi:hypothetical protein